MPPRVLVTNGEYQQALAITRSLGRKGIEVHCASQFNKALSFRSKYCRKSITVPGRGSSLGQSLLGILEEGGYEVLLPVGLMACWEASRLREEMEKHARVPVADLAIMESAVKKDLTIDVARGAGIPVPRTIQPTSLQEASSFARELGFPVVIKGTVGSGGKQVRVVRNDEELAEKYRYLSTMYPDPLVQEFVEGTGYGYSALVQGGKIIAESGHRRIHEHPPSGGASTMAETQCIPTVMEMGRKMLKALNWTGVAMVEFRGNPALGYRLMEVNPKFWGSLDLAIAAGVDYPYLDYLMAMGKEVPDSIATRDVTYQWILPDLMYSIDVGKLSGYAVSFLDPSVKKDLDWDDPVPTMITLREILAVAKRGINVMISFKNPFGLHGDQA